MHGAGHMQLLYIDAIWPELASQEQSYSNNEETCARSEQILSTKVLFKILQQRFILCPVLQWDDVETVQRPRHEGIVRVHQSDYDWLQAVLQLQLYFRFLYVQVIMASFCVGVNIYIYICSRQRVICSSQMHTHFPSRSRRKTHIILAILCKTKKSNYIWPT